MSAADLNCLVCGLPDHVSFAHCPTCGAMPGHFHTRADCDVSECVACQPGASAGADHKAGCMWWVTDDRTLKDCQPNFTAKPFRGMPKPACSNCGNPKCVGGCPIMAKCAKLGCEKRSRIGTASELAGLNWWCDDHFKDRCREEVVSTVKAALDEPTPMLDKVRAREVFQNIPFSTGPFVKLHDPAQSTVPKSLPYSFEVKLSPDGGYELPKHIADQLRDFLWRSLRREAREREAGLGIASLDLKPKRLDMSTWADEEDCLLPDEK